MKYGYARVSTTGQKKGGNSLDDQKASLLAAGAEEIITDTFTGTKLDRPEFTKLLRRIQPNDTLYVTKLDRFARTAAEGSTLVKELVNKGVNVHILNMGLANNAPAGKLMVQVMLAFAEFERDMIVERTQAGKAIARNKGVRVDGRPKKFTPQQMEHAKELLDGGNSYTQVQSMTGISKSTLIRARRAEIEKG
ncbi:MAG: recombinase family protein [Candidatus Limiplasma sp.]|nr:recombinase family protein [Candidatus Limiplasma sp.]